jgi:hypothetical protein
LRWKLKSLCDMAIYGCCVVVVVVLEEERSFRDSRELFKYSDHHNSIHPTLVSPHFISALSSHFLSISALARVYKAPHCQRIVPMVLNAPLPIRFRESYRNTQLSSFTFYTALRDLYLVLRRD